MKRKDKLKLLAERFGGCGCKEHCQIEQFGDEMGSNLKPRGRYSVCALEADKYGVKIPRKPEEE